MTTRTVTTRTLMRAVPDEQGADPGANRLRSTAFRGAHVILCLSALQYLATGLYQNDLFSIMLAAAILMIWLNVALIASLLELSRGPGLRLATGNWRKAFLNEGMVRREHRT
jgi:hypothetical protein